MIGVRELLQGVRLRMEPYVPRDVLELELQELEEKYKDLQGVSAKAEGGGMIGYGTTKDDCEKWDRDDNAYHYSVAGNGLWIQAQNPFLTARVPVAPGIVRGLSELNPLCLLPFGYIPVRLFDLALSVFLAHPEEERFVAVVYDHQNGSYQLVYPEQEGSAARIKYRHPEVAVLELHSHGILPARFSGQDDRDEQGLRLYGVVGNLTGERPLEIRLRVGVYGYFMPLGWGDVFDSDIPADVIDATVIKEKEAGHGL